MSDEAVRVAFSGFSNNWSFDVTRSTPHGIPHIASVDCIKNIDITEYLYAYVNTRTPLRSTPEYGVNSTRSSGVHHHTCTFSMHLVPLSITALTNHSLLYSALG